MLFVYPVQNFKVLLTWTVTVAAPPCDHLDWDLAASWALSGSVAPPPCDQLDLLCSWAPPSGPSCLEGLFLVEFTAASCSPPSTVCTLFTRGLEFSVQEGSLKEKTLQWICSSVSVVQNICQLLSIYGDWRRYMYSYILKFQFALSHHTSFVEIFKTFQLQANNFSKLKCQA